MNLARLIAISGVWNGLIGVGLLIPPFRRLMSLTVPDEFWAWLTAIFLWFTAAALILASRDLTNRASIVYYEGLLRLAAAILLVAIGVPVIGWTAWLFAVTDAAWGILYIVGLTRTVNPSHLGLLLDRPPISVDTTAPPETA